MLKTIWDKISLAFNRKPEGNIVLPNLPKNIMEELAKPRTTTRKPKATK
jgi:hypothetical protein